MSALLPVWDNALVVSRLSGFTSANCASTRLAVLFHGAVRALLRPDACKQHTSGFVVRVLRHQFVARRCPQTRRYPVPPSPPGSSECMKRRSLDRSPEQAPGLPPHAPAHRSLTRLDATLGLSRRLNVSFGADQLLALVFRDYSIPRRLWWNSDTGRGYTTRTGNRAPSGCSSTSGASEFRTSAC